MKIKMYSTINSERFLATLPEKTLGLNEQQSRVCDWMRKYVLKLHPRFQVLLSGLWLKDLIGQNRHPASLMTWLSRNVLFFMSTWQMFPVWLWKFIIVILTDKKLTRTTFQPFIRDLTAKTTSFETQCATGMCTNLHDGLHATLYLYRKTLGV